VTICRTEYGWLLWNSEDFTVYKFDYIAVDAKPEARFISLKRLLGERGFEPPTPLVPKQPSKCYLIDSLSLALRQRSRFYPVFGP